MATSPALSSIAQVLDGEVRGNSVYAATPGHSKHDRGTVITLDPNAPDGCLVHSFNGGDPLEIKAQLRRAGVLADRRRGQSSNRGRWRCTGTYDYDDGDGNVVYRTRRLECTDKPKRFVAERLEGGQWVNGLGACVRLPYRFTALSSAIRQARDANEIGPIILFAEGERKADRLAEMGFLATAIAFGANGWRDEYGEVFANSTMVILPDNDDPGRRFAETVKTSVEAQGATAVIVELPGLPPKGDIIDWQGTADDLRELVATALAGKLLPLPTLDLAALDGECPKAKLFAVERLAPLGEVTLFTGAGSAGKSLLGQQLATCAASGKPCLGLAVSGGPAIYMTCEDDEEQLHWRQSKLCAALDVPMASLAGRLHLVSLRGALDNHLCTFEQDGTLKPAQAFYRLERMLHATGAKLVILDNVAHVFTGSENDRGDVTRFVNLLNRLAGETGAAIIVIGHPNKSGADYSGSTAWLNAVRSQMILSHDLQTNVRTLVIGKANYAEKGAALRFIWLDGAFINEAEIPADTARTLRESVQAIADNALFLSCLRERTRQRRAVSEKPCATFAPKVFAGMAESKAIGPARLDKAMDRLFRACAIERGELPWHDGHRHPVQGLRETAGDSAGNTVREARETMA